MMHVLIVDDRDDNLYFLRILLEGNGFRVTPAHNGEEALSAAQEHSFDLVVSNLLMPVMDGFTLLRRWKTDPVRSRIPFIVYTATYTEEEDERFALSLGADAFVVKPTEPEELLHIFREILGRGEAATPSPIRDAEGEEETPAEVFNRVLFRKLEQKMLQLETTNLRLEAELAERVRAQEALEASTSLVRIAGEVGKIGGWTLHLPGRELSWSSEVCGIHDLPIGSRPSLDDALNYCTPETRGAAKGSLDLCISDGIPFDTEVAVLTASGERKWVRILGNAIRSNQGAILRVQGAYQDISERRELEQRSMRAERLESVGTLAAGMAHDLNNLFVPILLAVEQMKADGMPHSDGEMLGLIESSAKRGVDMVRQVLSLARGMDGAHSRIRIADVLADSALVVRSTFPQEIALRSRVEDDLWDIVGDSTHLHQVFMNLFVNARDAMPKGGTISVVAENIRVDQHYAAMIGSAAPGPYVRISISDTGEGIPRAILDRIFEPFFSTKGDGKGTGLGLSTVAAIVRRYGGFVSAYSEAGTGTTFRFHFPSAPQTSAETAVDPVHPGSLHGAGECILIVDDEAGIRSITEQTLTAFGYRVLTATDGADAIAVFGRCADEIDLVLTDTVMPIMDGPTAIRAIVKIRADAKIVLASGAGSESAEARAREIGASGYLPKPYTAHALLATIQRTLHPTER